MAGKEAIFQEFHNNEEHRSLLLNNVQPTGTLIASGCGTFGKVEKVKVNLSIRAGKIFSDKIYEKTLQKLSKVIIVTNFVQVCKQIVGIDHPNIVKVFGTSMLSNNILPMLVMELMDNNLHQYLETEHNVLLVLKQSILEDVGKGLLFLHTQSPDPIIHRDLTAFNVLLTSSLVARVADVGNSSFADLAMKHAGVVEYPPKVKVYMPPESEMQDEGKRSSPSLDVFSFGHLVLFTAIQVFPDNLLPSDYCHEENPEWIVGRSEVDRRKEYFQQMDLKLPRGDKNPLVILARDCLQDNPSQRPSTEDLLARMRQMVDDVGRIPGDHETMDRMEVIKLLHQHDTLHTMSPQEKEEYHSRISALEAENEKLRMKIHSLEVESAKEMEEKEKTINDKNIQLLETEKQVEKLQAEHTMTILKFKEALANILQKHDSHKQLLCEAREKVEKLRLEEEELRTQGEADMTQFIKDMQLTLDPVTMPSPTKSPILNLTWDQLPDTPVPLPKHPCAAAINRTIYVGGVSLKDHAHTVFTYDFDNPDSWNKLPRCPRRDFGMFAIENILVVVGGVDSTHKKSNKVTVWDPTATGQQWKEGYYPSLINSRVSPSIVSYDNWLIVIGGTPDKPSSLIEKLDLESHKAWSPCPPLPEKCVDISAVVVKSNLYITGSTENGTTSISESGKVVYSTLIPVFTRIKKPKDMTAWKTLPSIPNLSTSLCSISRKSILAFGGEIDSTSSLAKLSPLLSLDLKREEDARWERVGSLPSERSFCTCLRLGGDKVLVLGGTQHQAQEGLKRVDMCTIRIQGRR